MRFADPEAQAEIDRLTAIVKACQALAEEWAVDEGRAWIKSCADDLTEALAVGKFRLPF